jgi:Core-2/I-Branching enzyme
MVSRWHVRNIKRCAVFSVLGIACYFVLEFAVSSDAIDFESAYSFQVTLPRDGTDSKQNSSHVSTHGNTMYGSLSSDPGCHWDTLGPPESVRRAGCNKGECDIITCRRILANDSEAILAATDFMNARKRELMSEQEVLQMASSCAEFRLRGGYRDEPLRPADADFPIAFNVLIHWHIEQFERLLRAIYRPQNIYCIHVDAKTSYTFHAAIEAIARCFDNIFVSTKRHRVVYAGFSRLEVCFYCVVFDGQLLEVAYELYCSFIILALHLSIIKNWMWQPNPNDNSSLLILSSCC